MALVFATGNKHKFEEVSSVLGAYDIDLEIADVNLVEPDYSSIERIAEAKVKQAFQILKQPVIVDDTGIYFEAYPNFPGTNAKWAFETIGYAGFFKLLKGTSKKASFKTVIAFFDGVGKPNLFSGELGGSIALKVHKPKANVLPYERIFIPDKQSKPMVYASREEKNSCSHRAVAAEKLAKFIETKKLDSIIDSVF